MATKRVKVHRVERPPAPPSVRVRVRDGFAVVADGAQRSGGALIEVDEPTAQVWVARGWVELVE